MKTLPHGFGAAVGYTMIEDEIKTIDDAINEATLEMVKNKREYKNQEKIWKKQEMFLKKFLKCY